MSYAGDFRRFFFLFWKFQIFRREFPAKIFLFRKKRRALDNGALSGANKYRFSGCVGGFVFTSPVAGLWVW